MWPKHYSLKKDHDKHFEIHDARDGKSFVVSKKELHPANQIKVMKMQKFADGGEVMDLGLMNDVDKKPAPPLESLADTERRLRGERVETDSAASDLSAEMTAPPGMRTTNLEEATQSPMLTAMHQPMVPPSSAPVQSAVPQAPTQPQLPAPAVGVGDLNKLQAQQTKGIQMESHGLMAQNKEIAKLQEANIQQQQAQMQQFQQTMKSYQDQADQLTKEIVAGKVDPHKYWNSKDTSSKVSTALGVLLSGIGQGLMKSNSNMAWDSLQKNIDRDITAQKDELGKKQTLLSDNFRMQGNMIQAENATRIQLASIMQGQLAKMAAQTNDPIIQGRAQQQIAQIGQAMLPLKVQLAQHDVAQQMRASLQKASQPRDEDPSMYVRHMVPEHKQAEAFKEIETAQNTKHMAKNILEAFDQAAKENTAMKTGAGLLRTPPGVFALHQHMQPTFKDLEGTVRQAAMDNTFKNVTPMPGDMESTIKTKRQALEQYLQSKMSAPTAKGFGIDLSQFKSTSPIENPPETKTMGGVQYEKVKGGWKRVR